MKILSLLVAGIAATAQSPLVGPAQTFEVVSIKPNRSGSDSRRAGTSPGGSFTASNVSLRLLVAYAFGVREFQIIRGPYWLDTEKYDIAARAATSKEMTRDEVKPFLQSLLGERFQLRFHRETKEGLIYSLVVARNGPKFSQRVGTGTSGISASTDGGKAVIAGTGATVSRLAEYLGGQVGRPVNDNTGLKGEYDFRLEWAPDLAPDAGAAVTQEVGPSVFTAIQEQLGLRLDSTRGLIEMIVIDSAQKPSEN